MRSFVELRWGWSIMFRTLPTFLKDWPESAPNIDPD